MIFTFINLLLCLLLLSCVKENKNAGLLSGAEPTKITLTKGKNFPFINNNRLELDGLGFAITEKIRQKISGCKIRINYEPSSMKLTYEMDLEPNFRVRRNFDLSSDTDILQNGDFIFLKHMPKTREGEKKFEFKIYLRQTTDKQSRPLTLGAMEQEIPASPERPGLSSLQTECNTIDELKKPDTIGSSISGLDSMRPKEETPKPLLPIQGDKIKETRFYWLNTGYIVINVRTIQLDKQNNSGSKLLKSENFTIPHDINVRPIFSYQVNWPQETRSAQFKSLQFEFPYSANNNFKPKSGINSCNAKEVNIAMDTLAETMVDSLSQLDFYNTEWGNIARQILTMAWEMKVYTTLNYP